ncbi:reducing type I polyketide synthase, partial [Teratosphaeria nubilosa]
MNGVNRMMVNGNAHDNAQPTVQSHKDDIAIIGMSCRAPGDATSPEKLWQLCVEGRNAWTEIPKERYSQKAFYHPQSEHPGRSNVTGAHFLNEDVSLFDATFFGLSSEVASSMDPQLRLQLESTFEALENAGVPLSVAAGSQTAVFAGSFFRDYYDSLLRDPDTLPRYCLTGNGAAMLSNRVSHFFDLRGPSVTVDTGCSTGLTALHLACQSLRTGESTMAIVGGANVLLNPDNFIAMSCLGFLGSTGRSFSFDHRAEGYGRGEGVATIVIKPLPLALRDGDTVRAVIKATLLNQDGRTPTVTSPSQEAQEILIRQCYANAGLHPKDTAYVEAHGTGTKAGDPVELRALANVFGLDRPIALPLYLSSLKANLGHLESASGIAAIIKVALALDHGIIPPSTSFEMPIPQFDFSTSCLVIPTEAQTWPQGAVRRASLNGFGYGGANAHVIMEESPVRARDRRPDVPETIRARHFVAGNGHINGHHNGFSAHSSIPNVFVLSAKDEEVAQTMLHDLKVYLSRPSILEKDLDDLAYTLTERRSRFPWVTAFSAGTKSDLELALEASTSKPRFAPNIPRLGFVFNGQGAQWYAMGRELIGAYDVFISAVHQAQRCLESFGAEWSLIQELTRSEKESRVNSSALSMPLCTAIQLALVDLLRSWNAMPSAVTGHSSGEAAAAYAADAIDFKTAMAISYFRGKLTMQYQKRHMLQGGMLAAGIGAEEAAAYLQGLGSGKAVVACINSPASVTISGDLEAIAEVEAKLAAAGIFCRRIEVGSAYHSHHMLAQSDEYARVLGTHFTQMNDTFGAVRYSSALTGETVCSAKELGPAYWVNNMISPVLFSQSLSNMCVGLKTPSDANTTRFVDALIEIGPHSALAGPIRHILSTSELDGSGITYASCLVRNKNAVTTLQSLACALLMQGYPVKLENVNNYGRMQAPRMMHDLPSYPWNHNNSYWMEPRVNREHRHRQHAPHDLLGSRVLGGSASTPTWRHIITTSQIPWTRDHVVQSEIVYPGAGFIAMALEAYQQLLPTPPHEQLAYRLFNVAFTSALVIPDTAGGIEVLLHMQKRDRRLLDWETWWEFRIESIDRGGKWQTHCIGSITRDDGVCDATTALELETTTHVVSLMSRETFYEVLQHLGIEYGPAFRTLTSISQAGNRSTATIKIPDTAALMPAKYEHEHIIHPTALDAVFQCAFAALPHAGSNWKSAMIPTKIALLIIRPWLQAKAGDTLQASASISRASGNAFDASAMAMLPDTNAPAVEVHKLHCQGVGSGLETREPARRLGVCSSNKWLPDLTFMSTEQFQSLLRMSPDPDELETISDAKKAAFYFLHDTLSQMNQKDIQGLEWHHKRFYNWMLCQVEQAKSNRLATRSSKWLTSSAGVKQMVIERVGADSVSGQMIVRIGSSLLQILRKQVAPLELMLKEKLLYSYYENALRTKRSYLQVQKLVELFGHKQPRANILEIGGGTAGCSVPVLRALGEAANNVNSGFLRYTFTDISPGFFERAREKLAVWGPQIEYKVLDIEQPPDDQGFSLGTYDLIVACLVLHATKSMTRTMSNVRKLLKPNGKLIMVETTQDTLDVQIIFGTLPGWWLSEEEERKHSPSLTADFWDRVLRQTGFTGLECSVRDSDDPVNYSQSVLMSSVVPLEDPNNPGPSLPVTVIWAGSGTAQSSTQSLVDKLHNVHSTAVSVISLEQAPAAIDGSICLIVDDFTQPLLTHMDGEKFGLLRDALCKARGAMWLHFGGTLHCGQPQAGLIQGLFRVLRFENRAKRYITYDLERAEALCSDQTIYNLASILRSSFGDCQQQEAVECEYAERDNVVLVPRLYEDVQVIEAALEENSAVEPLTTPFRLDQREIRMEIGTPGMLDSLCFKEVSPMVELPEDFVEIETRAFGLNFRDVMVAMGQLDSDRMGFECSGVVTRVGARCKSFSVEDRVCGLTRGDWATKNRVHESSVVKIPDSMSFEVAASLPVAFVTAYYSLFDIARLERRESVLIHAAAGGVGQAAIALAKWAGAEIFATAGNEQKRRLLHENYCIPQDHIFSSRNDCFVQGIMTASKGSGVDVVLNSLSGALLQATWRCIAKFGRFVEIGKKDIEQSKCLDMSPFARAATFTAVDLTYLGEERHAVVARVLRRVFELLAQGTLEHSQLVKVFSITDIGRAFRTMAQGKHIGKIVIKAGADDPVPVIPQRLPLQLRSDATYVIVGGLGGIGRSVTVMLAERGAKHIALLSRSAGTKISHHDFIRKLESKGCNVLALPCNIADRASLEQAKDELQRRSFPRVCGVIQGAMVLDDSVFERMSHAQWQAAIRPKVDGTINLHEAFPDVDFFVMLSSLIGISGHSSQANYAAGSTFQDAFARWRTAQGLPAVSIDLGFVRAVGYVAETQSVVERMFQMGYRPPEESEVLRVIEFAIRHPLRSVEGSQVIIGLGASDETTRKNETMTSWRREPRFSALRSIVTARGSTKGVSQGDDSGMAATSTKYLSDALAKALSYAEAVDVIATAVSAKLSEMFMVPSAEIELSKPPSAYGLDSLVAVELRNWLFTRLQAELTIFEVLQCVSLFVLADTTAARSKLVRKA